MTDLTSSETSKQEIKQEMDDFAEDVAAIYATLSERQERLCAECEAAIFGNLDSLYED